MKHLSKTLLSALLALTLIFVSGAMPAAAADGPIRFVSDAEAFINPPKQDCQLAMARDSDGVLWGVFGYTLENMTPFEKFFHSCPLKNFMNPCPSEKLLGVGKCKWENFFDSCLMKRLTGSCLGERTAGKCLFETLFNSKHENTHLPLTIWKGTSPTDMVRVYDAPINFVGPAGMAFNGIPYPSGVASRGCVWPMGLYIDESDTWYCYFHNETGWGTINRSGYITTGYAEGEPDFRHIGAMTSTDQGHSWEFAGWVVAPYEKPYTVEFQPENGKLPDPQPGPYYKLGNGDFGILVNDNDGYIYIYYTSNGNGVAAARAPMSDPVNFKKYFEGAWDEPGLEGRETILINTLSFAIPTIAYSTYLNQYVMFGYYTPAIANPTDRQQPLYSLSDDMVNWSDPVMLNVTEPTVGDPRDAYWSIYSASDTGNPKFIGKDFLLFHNLWSKRVYMMHITTD